MMLAQASSFVLRRQGYLWRDRWEGASKEEEGPQKVVAAWAQMLHKGRVAGRPWSGQLAWLCPVVGRRTLFGL